MRIDVDAYHGALSCENTPIEIITDSYKAVSKLYNKHPERQEFDPSINRNLHSYGPVYDFVELNTLCDVFKPNEDKFSVFEGLKEIVKLESVWSDRRFKVKINNERIKTSGLRITLYAPLKNFKLQNPDVNPIIHLFINKEYIADIPINAENLDYYNPMTGYTDDFYEIEMVTNCHFTPKDIELSDDIRDLSLGVRYIGDAQLEEVFHPESGRFSISEGYYIDAGQNFSWTEQYFSTIIRNEQISKDGLCIQMSAFPENCRKQFNDIEPTIQLYINDNYIQDIPMPDSFTTYRFTPEPDDSNTYNITLKTNSYFIPNEIELGDDIRKLSLALYYVGN